MIMGGGRTAVRSVKIMPEYMNIKVIERDADRCEYLNEMFDEDKLVINGDGRDTALLVEEAHKKHTGFRSSDAQCRNKHTRMHGRQAIWGEENNCVG